MARPKDVKLRDFLINSNLAVPQSPPWVHSTACQLVPFALPEWAYPSDICPSSYAGGADTSVF
jgi:hypothetical protein